MTLDDDIANLSRIPLFAFFEPSALRMLALSAEARLLRGGDVLFRRGETSDGGYVLTIGSIALDPYDERGPRSLIIRPWTLIGETALVAPSTRRAAAVAREPATVLKILRPTFHVILEQHPATAARVRDFFRRRLVHFIREVGVDESTSDIDPRPLR